VLACLGGREDVDPRCVGDALDVAAHHGRDLVHEVTGQGQHKAAGVATEVKAMHGACGHEQQHRGLERLPVGLDQQLTATLLEVLDLVQAFVDVRLGVPVVLLQLLLNPFAVHEAVIQGPSFVTIEKEAADLPARQLGRRRARPHGPWLRHGSGRPKGAHQAGAVTTCRASRRSISASV
jgi:hypothetical protein